MKSLLSLWLAMSCFIILALSCKEHTVSLNKGIQNDNPKSFSDYLNRITTSDFVGTVVDTANIPLTKVSITIGNKTTLTDSSGHFSIKNTIINLNFIQAFIKKNGYMNNELWLV